MGIYFFVVRVEFLYIFSIFIYAMTGTIKIRGARDKESKSQAIALMIGSEQMRTI